MKYMWLLLFVLLAACSEKQEKPKQVADNVPEKTDTVVISENYQTEYNEAENIDSPAFWQGPNGENWLLATSKAKHYIVIYEASTGKRIKTIGQAGKGPGQFSRPNGIWVIDNLMLVVERDNKRIQVMALPEFKPLGFIAEKELKKPYGLFVDKIKDGYRLFVTDNYEMPDESIPPDTLLGERVLIYNFNVTDGKLYSNLVKKFGDTAGNGAIKIVESVYADPENDNLLISEELETNTHIKVYSLEGKFKNKIIGEGMFRYQSEGMTLLNCGNGIGYWICTDQSTGDNTFYIFDRKTLSLVSIFKAPKTRNTDGVWLTQTSFQGFPEGAFFAVNDDGGVNAIGIKELKEKCKLKCK